MSFAKRIFVRTEIAGKVRSSMNSVFSFALESRVASLRRAETADLIPDDDDMYMTVVAFHTVLLSVMTLTMHPVPAISVSWNRFVSKELEKGAMQWRERAAHLLMPAQQHASAHITPARHSHPLVQVLHERIMSVL